MLPGATSSVIRACASLAAATSPARSSNAASAKCASSSRFTNTLVARCSTARAGSTPWSRSVRDAYRSHSAGYDAHGMRHRSYSRTTLAASPTDSSCERYRSQFATCASSSGLTWKYGRLMRSSNGSRIARCALAVSYSARRASRNLIVFASFP
eukprot:31386-Pelagococcus_subviridis.AAC.10